MSTFSEKKHFQQKNRESFYIISISLIVFFFIVDNLEAHQVKYSQPAEEESYFYCGTSFMDGYEFNNLPVFKNNCASCHFYNKDMTGPALKGSVNRLGEEYFALYITNQDSLIKSGDSIAINNVEKWESGWRHKDSLTTVEIQTLLDELSK